MCKPLVVKMLEYLNRKTKQTAQTMDLQDMVFELQGMLEQCVDAQQEHQRVAYYDASKDKQPMNAVRSPKNKKKRQ